MEAIEISKDAILVCEHQALELSAAGGFGIGASCAFAAAPGFFASSSATADCCGSPALGFFA
jgi:hypothetical protein